MVVALDPIPPETHGHIDVMVVGLQSGWVEPDDGRQADLATGGAHLNIEVLHIQTPVDVTFNLKGKKCLNHFRSVKNAGIDNKMLVGAPLFFSYGVHDKLMQTKYLFLSVF